MGKSAPPSNLIPGTLAPLILKALSRESMHGYAISRWIHEAAGEVLRVEEGVLYPALHKLERDGLIESEWGVNDTGRRAKFYGLTDDGRDQLGRMTLRWRASSKAVSAILELPDAES